MSNSDFKSGPAKSLADPLAIFPEGEPFTEPLSSHDLELYGSYQNPPVKNKTDGSGFPSYQPEAYVIDMAERIQSPERIAMTIYVWKWIDRERGGGRTYEAIAADLGVSKPSVVNLHKHARGAGPKFEQALARILHGGSIDATRDEAARVYERDGIPREIRGKLGIVEDSRRGESAAAEAGHQSIAILEEALSNERKKTAVLVDLVVRIAAIARDLLPRQIAREVQTLIKTDTLAGAVQAQMMLRDLTAGAKVSRKA